jgi:tetratricopeptide (TPR) repeat protein
VLGRVYNELGRYSESLKILENASQVFSESQGEITYLSGYLSCFLGYAHFKLGNVHEAVGFLKKSLYLFRDSKRTQGLSMTLFFLAEILTSQKDFKLSAKIYGASEMFRIKHGRALDHRESEWDRDLQTELRNELASAFEEEFGLGLGLSEQGAFILSVRALDQRIPTSG